MRSGLRLSDGKSLCSLECEDKAYVMKQEPHNRSFANISDGKLIGRLVTGQGIKMDKRAHRTRRNTQLRQFNTNDWNFVLQRATASDLLIANYNNTVRLIAPQALPKPSTTLRETVKVKKDVIELQFSHLFGNSTTRAYDRAQYLTNRQKMMQHWSDF